MRRIAAGSVILWFFMVILLAGNNAGGAIVPVSILMLISLAATRITLWSRYRRDMKAELMAQEMAQQDDEG